MSIDFLPETYTKVTRLELVVPVEGHPDLPHPSSPTLFPTRVEVSLTREEGTPRGDRERASVSVVGRRLLKSGAYGKQTSSSGWESAVNESWHGTPVERPQWLTEMLIELLPESWSPALFDLTGGAA